MNGGAPQDWNALVERLVRGAGFQGPFCLRSIRGGRNNRVYRIELPERTLLLKTYFHHPQDPRDRLGPEFAFLAHLHGIGSHYAARPYATDASSHMGVMEFIDGVRPKLAEVTEAHIDHAVCFFSEANAQNDSASALSLPAASEACFSIAEHLDKTQRRVDRLSEIVPDDDLDRQAKLFVNGDLVPVWREIRKAIQSSIHLGDESRLPMSERCLSPSDFGFHNSLQSENGGLRFVDFEYAGWDDPAKLISDFANQPDMLLDRSLSRRFSAAVIGGNANPDALRQRVDALEPLYQIKWACICLNDFLGTGRTRRAFTEDHVGDGRTRREIQFGRAQTMLERARNRQVLS